MKKPQTVTPLNEASLNELALTYVARYATSKAKLIAYLARKIRERGWSGERPYDVHAVADRMVELRYIDDAAYAVMKAGALVRRGYGKRRLGDIYYRDGIGEEDRSDANQVADSGRWDAAVVFARKKRIGAFAREQVDQDHKRKQIAAFLRAGHDMDIARQLVALAPGTDVEALRPDELGCDE